MALSKMTGFCKNEDCPTSHELLEFQNGEIAREGGRAIRTHIAKCEFCSAEVEFYSLYPQEGEINEVMERAEIPAPLFELAEALLKNRHADASSLDSLLRKEAVG